MVFTGITTVIKKWAGLVIFHAKAGNITSYSMEIFVFPAIAGTRIFPRFNLGLVPAFVFSVQFSGHPISYHCAFTPYVYTYIHVWNVYCILM